MERYLQLQETTFRGDGSGFIGWLLQFYERVAEFGHLSPWSAVLVSTLLLRAPIMVAFFATMQAGLRFQQHAKEIAAFHTSIQAAQKMGQAGKDALAALNKQLLEFKQKHGIKQGRLLLAFALNLVVMMPWFLAMRRLSSEAHLYTLHGGPGAWWFDALWLPVSWDRLESCHLNYYN
jgi:membrane protein insertase Oxa1/YidC/SpoIIIJ